MKRLLSLFSMLLMLCFAYAQHDLATTSIDPSADAAAIARMRHKMDSIRKYRPTVAVVLSGGGAKGAAHVGVLEYIEEMGIPVDMVVGTSMGGVVGGLYAMGYPASLIDTILVNMNWSVMMSDFVPTEKLNYRRRKDNETYALRIPFYYDNDKNVSDRKRRKYFERETMEVESHAASSDVGEQAIRRGMVANMPEGITYGYNVYNLINSLTVGYQDSMNFSDLPIPYCCVAADLVTLKTKYWTSGCLPEAMRSTMSIPLYFTPVRNRGMVLVDGGTRNNFPTDMARAMGADYVIGVDLSQNRSFEEVNGVGKLLQQSIALMGKEAYDHNIPLADAYIHPDMDGMNMFSFQTKNIVECIRRGREAAKLQDSSLQVIRRAVTSRHGKSLKTEVRKQLPHGVNIAKQDILVGDIRFKGIGGELTDFLLRNIEMDTGKRYNRDAIENALAVLYGSGLFKNVYYRIEGSHEPYTLVFQGERGPIHQFGVSLRVNSRDLISLGLNFGFNRRKPNGFKFDASAVIGKNLKGGIDLYYVPRRGPAVGIDVRSSYTQLKVLPLQTVMSDYILNTLCTFNYWNNRLQLYVGDNGWLHNGYYKGGFEVNVLPYALSTFFLDPVADGNADSSMVESVDEYDYVVDGLAYLYRNHWNNHTMSIFAEGAYDNTDDKYFPTRGVDVGGRYDLVFHSETPEGEKYRYHVLNMHVKGVIPVINRFVIILSGNIQSIQSLDFKSVNHYVASYNDVHQPFVGGVLDREYNANHLSFVGYNVVQTVYASNTNAVAKMDIRYQFGRKDYVSFIASVYKAYNLFDKFGDHIRGVDYIRPTDYCFALQYGHKSLIGPILFNVHWANKGRPTRWGAYLSVGFDF
ncbi:MAG: patatin-like phospholipase family protein [Bacteroidales bacterium]|nr:patatin-like phospholipase family protein [Bacteroidales bacterium]